MIPVIAWASSLLFLACAKSHDPLDWIPSFETKEIPTAPSKAMILGQPLLAIDMVVIHFWTMVPFLIVFCSTAMYIVLLVSWVNPEISVKGDPDIFQTSTYFTEGRTNLPQNAIGPKDGVCTSISKETYSNL